jgi:hypothetical protein
MTSEKGIQQSDNAHGEEGETPEIGETSGSEDVPSHIVDPVPLGIGIVKVIIRLCVV